MALGSSSPLLRGLDTLFGISSIHISTVLIHYSQPKFNSCALQELPKAAQKMKPDRIIIFPKDPGSPHENGNGT